MHIQRGIHLPRKNILTPLLRISARRSKTIRTMRADNANRGPPIAREHELPSRREIPREPPPGIQAALADFAKIHRAGAEGCLRLRGTRSDLIRT